MKILIYLWCPVGDRSSDTLLYKPKDAAARLARLGEAGDYTDQTYRHEDPEDHVVGGRVAFEPNRLVAFPRTRWSLHGLAPLARAASPRYLISIHFKHARGGESTDAVRTANQEES
jgi:hypothetical protein